MRKPEPEKLTAAQKRAEKAESLRVATELLSSRVGALADAVQINNARIAELQKEVNCKPDDEEVKLITGMAQAERKQQLKVAIWTAVISSILAATLGGVVAFTTAEKHGEARCKVNAKNIEIIVDLLESRIDPEDTLQPTIDALKANRNEC